MNAQNTTALAAIKVIQPTDHIDIGNAFELKGSLQELLRQGHKRVVIDLASVQYIDSAGLSALMAVVHAFQGAGGAVRLCGPQPNVLKIFHLTRLDEYLPLSASLEEARAHLEAPPA
jgi:anti-sigma B factor antagonist